MIGNMWNRKIAENTLIYIFNLSSNFMLILTYESDESSKQFHCYTL